MAIKTALKEALNDATSSGKFIDTQVILYSRRDSSRRICKPKALYTNSHVLKAIPYFRDLLSGTFSESEIRDFPEIVDEGEFAEDYGYSSDSDLEEDWDFDSPNPPKCPSQALQQEVQLGQYKEPAKMGWVIRIRDVAFITFQAFLLCRYARKIRFAPFGSEENRRSRSPEIAWAQEREIPRPSPKSIYRLADKYDFPALKSLALRNIKRGLHKCDIVQEAFSVFTSRYDEVKTMEVDHLLSVWLSGGEEESRTVREKLREKLSSYAAGELDHAADVVMRIRESSNNGMLASPGTTDAAWHLTGASTDSPVDAEFLGLDFRGPLIKSLRSGNLLDRKYWARRSRGGVIEPIFVCSAAISGGLLNLDALLELHPGSEGRLETNDEDRYLEDSDYEDEDEPTGKSASRNTKVRFEVRESKLLPVLAMGSSIAWKSLFFYLLTGEIVFAPLKSQGPRDRSKWVLEQTESVSPVPCSPKTIYQFTKILSWKDKSLAQTLSDLALQDFEGKLTQENTTTETFSSFASRHPEFMVVGWKHPSMKVMTKATRASVLELIEGMKGGSAAHRVHALEFGLYSALRRKGPAKGTLALLRCSIEECPANANPTLLDAVGGDTACPKHGEVAPPMKCSKCDHVRKDRCNFCKGCLRLFE